MSGAIADGEGKVLMLEDLIEAMDKRERMPSNVPKVDTFHFNGERVSDWLDFVEQALVGLSDAVKFQRILKCVLHGHHQEVEKVINAANGSSVRFKDGMQRKYRLGDGLLTTVDLKVMNKDDFTTVGTFVQEFKKKARKVNVISEEAQCAIFLGWLAYIWMFNFELERIPGNKNQEDGLSRINWDKQEGEAVEDTPPVDSFLDQEEDIRLHINEWSPQVPSCVGHPIWHAPNGYEQKAELVLKPFEEEDPWGSKDVQWMMKLVLAGTHSLVEEVRPMEEGPDRVERYEELIGGMHLLVNTLLLGNFDQICSLNPAENKEPVPENQDDEFEEGEIKEAFRAEEYDGIYLELGLLLSSDFAKTAMPRGGRETRPPRRPLGASGGYERHGSHHREDKPVYDERDIKLFLDDFFGYAEHMGWTMTQTIERLTGAGKFEEPIARIRREAGTWPEVETRMQELRPSPVRPDVHSMQEEASLFSPEQRMEEPPEREMGITVEDVIEGRPQRLDTPEYRLEGIGIGPEPRTQELETEPEEPMDMPQCHEVAREASEMPLLPESEKKKKRGRRSGDSSCFFCKSEEQRALQCPKFLKNLDEGKVTESGGMMYDRHSRVVERSADGGGAQLYRQNQEEMSE
ncbi:hypothetical protein CBR_g24085 [Chara braunii]|uniref:Uncharacterized protein n=1 Tax=Chara braunii TaxID=69332 RepID=A0A388L5Q8_CHABU|nr:hypothetical protein CBR_g24085 [Chara braunii]|eukprot:GBG77639.1 hypothetical protein CBR_g24085 [Chara braunii]